ncbi:MAG: metal-dependent hydrolase [Planctomycetota bacterium]
MDPISQTALGSAVAGQAFWSRLGRWSLVLGASGGALADIDVAWGGLGDPALPWELHRHFTHALVFIPVGGVLAALPFLWFKRIREQRVAAILASTAGYATHGVLDAATAWGTFLYWPFSDQRAGWDWISVVDPLFTLPLLIGIGLTYLRPKGWTQYANTAGLVLALLYIGLGVQQHNRGLAAQEQLAAARGHVMEQRQVTPVIGNLLLWRSIYVRDGRVYADALRLVPGQTPALLEGTSQPLYVPSQEDLSQRQRDILERLRIFAEGYLVQESDGLIGDQRFSFETAGFRAVWGVKLLSESEDIAWHDTEMPDGLLDELLVALLQGKDFEPMTP